MRTENVPNRRRRRSRGSKKKLKNLDDDKPKGQKIVDCIYLGLVCCDMPCTIL